MSDPRTLDEGSLRQRLKSSLLGGEGSLYLRTLCCAYLAAEEDVSDLVLDTFTEEDALYTIYLHQAEVEGVDAGRLAANLQASVGLAGDLS